MDLIAESGRTLTRMLTFERKRVHSLHRGDRKDYRLLGRKGAALCELTQLGLPIPPGFVITTENYLEYVNHGEELSPDLIKAITNGVHGIEKETGKNFGKPSTDGTKMPLLFAVRAGTAVIVPGIMDSILNVGMSDQVVHFLIELNPGLRHFALDMHRRFLYQYGILVLRNPASKYEKILTAARDRDGVQTVEELSVDALTYIVSEYRRITEVPEDPYEQLTAVIEAMYQHSYSPRVSQSLDESSTPNSQLPRALAITVQAMVYGNLNRDSGSGVVFSRRGQFRADDKGKDVRDDRRSPASTEVHSSLLSLLDCFPSIYEELNHCMRKLERLEPPVEYIEFTIEDGVLYILETSSVNLRPNLKGSRYVAYYDLLVQQEDVHEDSKSSSADAKHGDSKSESAPHNTRNTGLLRVGSVVEPGLDEVLEDETDRVLTKSRSMRK